jgi:hypothetical protein
MELLRDMGHVESCFGLFGDSVSVGARFAPTYHWLESRFGLT